MKRRAPAHSSRQFCTKRPFLRRTGERGPQCAGVAVRKAAFDLLRPVFRRGGPGRVVSHRAFGVPGRRWILSVRNPAQSASGPLIPAPERAGTPAIATCDPGLADNDPEAACRVAPVSDATAIDAGCDTVSA